MGANLVPVPVQVPFNLFVNKPSFKHLDMKYNHQFKLQKYHTLRFFFQSFAATDVISHALELQTELGQKVQEILLRGEAIPEELAAKLIEEKINSPEVAHHGNLFAVLHPI